MFLGRFYSNLACKNILNQVKSTILHQKALRIELLPYQVVFCHQDALKFMSEGVIIETTSNKLLELNYAKTEGFGHALISGNRPLKIMEVSEKFFCSIPNFICATSGLKLLHEDNQYEMLGNGSLALSVDEILSLDEKETLLVKKEALVGFDGFIEKELVKILEFKFWKVTGPGTIAISFETISQSPKVNSKIDQIAKDYDQTKSTENEPESILKGILDKNDIII